MHHVANLQDLVDAVEALPAETLGDRAKADVTRDIQRVGHVLGTPLDQIAANRGVLTRRLAALHPRRVRKGNLAHVSPKRIANMRANVKRAFELTRLDGSKRHGIRNVSPCWLEIYNAIPTPRHGCYLRPTLSAFIQLCDAEGLAPADLADRGAEMLEAYYRHLADNPLRDHPERQLNRTINAWNTARRQVAGWPDFDLPHIRRREAIPVEAFSPEFRASVDEALAALRRNPRQSAGGFREAVMKGLSGDGRPTEKVYEEQTVRASKRTIWNAARTLVRIGYTQPGQLRHVKQLLAPDAAAAFLTHVQDRTGADLETAKRSTLATYAADLRRVARRLTPDMPADVDQAWAEMVTYANSFLPTGMSEAKRAQIRQFDDPHAYLDLEDLEYELVAEAERERHAAGGVAGPETAFKMMKALVLGLLRQTAFRSGNILNLKTTDIEWPTRRGGPAYLYLSADRTKNDREAEGELEPEFVELLHLWIKTYRPVLTGGDGSNDWLLPGDTPDGRVSEALPTSIKKLVWRRLGLVFNLHFARTIFAETLLAADIRNTDAAREGLGHKPGSATLEGHYARARRKAAFSVFRELSEKRRVEAGRSRSRGYGLKTGRPR
jgi:hypothetical protein